MWTAFVNKPHAAAATAAAAAAAAAAGLHSSYGARVRVRVFVCTHSSCDGRRKMAMGYLVEVEPGRVKLRQQVGIPRGGCPLCRVVSRRSLHDYSDVEGTGRRSTCITIVVRGERPPFPHRLVAAETTLLLPCGAEVRVERCLHGEPRSEEVERFRD